MSVTCTAFGTTQDGHAVHAFCLKNHNGLSVTILDYGATVQSFRVPGCLGVTDIVLGYDTVREYEENGGFLGATIGRVGNRIGRGEFSLAGKTYHLVCNDGPNHLHGGNKGFDKQMWNAAASGDASLRCTRTSPDGEEGYPGNLQVSVTFTLTPQNALSIVYDARTDQDTVVNLTNHSYFNLAGHGSVLNHQLQVFASRFTENDANCLPTGRLLEVAGTPFDFRVPKPIGQDLNQPDAQLICGHGYDHNFVLSGTKAAVLRCRETALELTVETDQPGMQVYSANGLTPRPGKNNTMMEPRGAICLETQLFPDGLSHYGFPCPILRAGQLLHRETRYRIQTL